MTTNMKRRTMLKGTIAVGAAATAGMLLPTSVWAWPQAAFDAKSVPDALKGILGSDASTASSDIKIKAPDIAENGAVVPVTVSTSLAGVESISILAAGNGNPMSGSFDMGAGAEGYVSTRIKLGKTGDVIAIVKAGGKLYSARKGVKVTIGGCGG